MKTILSLAFLFLTLPALVAQSDDPRLALSNPNAELFQLINTAADTLQPDAKTGPEKTAEDNPEQLAPCDNYDILQCGQTLYNQTNFGYGNKINSHCVSGTFVGPDHIYKIEITEPGPYKFVLEILDPVDLDIFVISDCQSTPVGCAYWSNEYNPGTGVYREIADGHLDVGIYYVIVDGQYNTSYGNYNISMNCSCTPLEKDVWGVVAETYFCENLESFDPAYTIEPQSSRWFFWENPNSTLGGDAALTVDSSGGKLARFYDNGVSTNPDLVYALDNKQSGRWRLSWQMRVENNKSAYFNLLHTRPAENNNNIYVYANTAYQVFLNSNGTGTVYVGTSNSSPKGRFAYPNGQWFNVVQIIDLYQDKVELWIDDNYVTSWTFSQGYNYEGFPQSSTNIAGINFYANTGNDYYIDNISFYRQKTIFIHCSGNDKLCLKNGQVYPNWCTVHVDLYTELEYGPCFSVCDLGGTYIHRGDTYTGQLDLSDLAPDSIRYDPCVQNAYGTNMPVPLYADVFMYYNDNGTSFNPNTNVVLTTGNPADVKYFVFTCNYDIGGWVGKPESDNSNQANCVYQQRNLNSSCNGGSTLATCDNRYYIVVTGTLGSTYSIQINQPGYCTPINPPVLNCGIPLGSSLPAGTGGSAFTSNGAAYNKCYVGPRNYNGTEKVYKFTLTKPSQVKVTLNSTTPGALMGIFLYPFICGRNCLNYAENTGSDPKAELVSSLPEGTYYLVIDRESTVGAVTFDLTLDCVPNSPYATFDMFISTFLPDGALCPADNTTLHQIKINGIANRFASTDQLYFHFKNTGQSTGISSANLTEQWGAPGPIKTINLPQDDLADGQKCSFLPGDTIFLRIDPTDPGSKNQYETKLIFKQVPGTNASNQFQINGVSYVDSIIKLEPKLFTVDFSDLEFQPSGTSGDSTKVLVLQSNLSWTVTEIPPPPTPPGSWIKSIIPSGAEKGENVAITVKPQAPGSYLPRYTYLQFRTNQPGQEFQYEAYVRIVQKGYCPPVTTAAINASALTICEGDLVTLTAVGSPTSAGLYKYKWSTNDTSAVISKMPLATTTYTVTVTNPNCSVTATATRQITVNPKPTSPISLGNKSMCTNGTIPTLRVSTNNQPNVTVDWYDAPSGGSNVQPGNSDYTPGAIVTKTYYAQSRNTVTGCVNPARTGVTLTVNPQPFITVIEKECAPNLLTYSVVLNTNGDSVSANIGNVSGGNGQYIVSGIPKDVMVFITATFTQTGCSRTSAITALSCPCPSIAPPVSGGNFAICSNDPIPTLSVSVGSNETAYWYNSNNVKVAEGLSYQPGSGGTFTVKAVDTVNNCMSAGILVTLAIHPAVLLSAGAPACSPNLQFFSVPVSTSPNVSSLTATQGTVSGSNGSFVVSNIPETSSVLITATDEATGCQKQLMIPAHDCPCPVVPKPISNGNKTVCDGLPFPPLQVTVNPGETADWFNAAGQLQVGGQDTTSFTPLTPGTYYAQRRVLLTGCTSAERTAVSLSILATPALAVLDDQCDPTLTSYHVTVSTDADQVNSVPAHFVQNNNNGTFTISGIPIGQLVVIRATFGGNGCFVEQSVQRNDCPCNISAPTIQGPNPVVICAGDALPELVATVNDPLTETVDWFAQPSGGSPLPGGSGTLVYQPTEANTYYAQARKKDAPGCVSTLRRSVAILATTPPVVMAGPDQTVCANEPVVLSGAVTGAASATWEASVAGGAFYPSANALSGLTYTPPGGVSNVVLTLVSSDPPGPCPAVSDALMVTFKPVPSIDPDTIYCSPNLLSYNVRLLIDPINALVQTNAGIATPLGGGLVVVQNIPKNTDLVLTVQNNQNGCSNQLVVPKYDCTCVFPDSPESKGNKEACSNDPAFPALEVKSVPTDIAVDWYDVPSNGAPLATDALQFVPTKGGNYYAESRNRLSNCTSLSRTLVTLTVKTSPVADAGPDLTVCPGLPVTLTAAGTNYGFQWSTNASTKTITVPGAIGTYVVTVTLNGCSDIDTVSVSTWPPVLSAIEQFQPIDCYGKNTGALKITASGGTPPYLLQWSNGITTPLNANLPAGNYSVLVTDTKGCRDTTFFDLLQPDPLVIADAKVVHADGSQFNGSITVTPSGGTPPYHYLWADGVFVLANENQNSIDSLSSSTYFLTITDNNGCTVAGVYSTVPIIEINQDNYVVVYPNPTEDILYLQFHLQQSSDIAGTVTDLLGRKMLDLPKGRASNETMELSLRNLPAGYYVLHLQIDKSHAAYQICIKH
ncbi:MAG: T9SS type A sorting domain-containing protein [Lewinellaceae bacterium]|nr:T9SS type A sorting domain-containing protein [Lewinellaceae bacterium]